jgi:hypothetical protein
MGREAEAECVVEARGNRILLGQISLEAMDFIVDPKRGKLVPRPESPDIPLIDVLMGVRRRLDGKYEQSGTFMISTGYLSNKFEYI